MIKNRWTQKERALLIGNYSFCKKEQLLEIFPNRTWTSIKLKARQLNLNYAVFRSNDQVGAKLNNMLNDTNEAFYWAGFLSADGSFVRNRLSLGLATKDSSHLINFCTFIECSNIGSKTHSSHTIKVQDAYYVPKIMSKFGLLPRKTYNPPNISWMKGDLFFAFFVGFADGDGSIGFQHKRRDCSLRIKIHGSWLPVLEDMNSKLSDMFGTQVGKVKIANSGYAVLGIYKNIVLSKMKSKIKEMELPVLQRKWVKIKEFHT